MKKVTYSPANMRQHVRASKNVARTSNAEFNHWYQQLPRPEQDRVDDLMEHNCFAYDTASDLELSYIRGLYTDMVVEEENSKDSEDVLYEVRMWAANHRIKGFQKFEKYGIYLEKHSIEDLIRSYIKYFNQNIREGGNGFDSDWDDDDTMDILYKDGTVRTINPSWDEGTEKISIDNIDSIILNGGWGTAFAGPSIEFEDYTTYDDIIDIRPQFSWGGKLWK